MRREQEATAGEVTVPIAPSPACYIKAALIERRFFEQTPDQAPTMRQVMTSLQRQTERHLNQVKDALSRTRAR